MMSIYDNSLGEYAKLIQVNPGTNLDMTKFASSMWLDSQHTRWDNGFPRKMGGRKLLDYGTDSITRAIYANIVNDLRRYVFMKDKAIIQVDVNQAGDVVSIKNRTPEGFEFPLPGENYNYSYTEFSVTNVEINVIRSITYLFFVPLENARNPLTNREKQVYFGRIDSDEPFRPYDAFINGSETPTLIKTSGGIIEQNQVLYIYGEGGLVYSTDPNDFTVIPAANISAGGSLKILAAKPWRDGDLLYWSPNMLYIGTATSLGYKLVPVTSMTIASPNSIVDGRNSTYYWMGLKQMYAFNGALQTFQNDNNRNYLYENLNKNYLGNCWGIFLEDFTELAWFVPQGNEKEASLGIYHNLQEQTWYKSIHHRSCGLTTGVPPDTIMADNRPLTNSTSVNYAVWYEDTGVNEVVGDNEFPIPAWVESKMFSIYLENVQANIALALRRYEKNIDQVGDMWLEINLYNYPDSAPRTLDPIKLEPTTTNVNFSTESSLFTFKFTSNTLDGFFQFGPLVINYENGNTRPTTSYLE